MSGIILAPNEISDLSRSVRPVAEEGTPAWGTAADVLGKGFKRFALEPDTVALWDFTRKLGNPLADLSPEGNDLTLNGDVVRAADGPFGWSYDFPGTDDYLITSGNPASLQITGELTVEVILETDSVTAKNPISKWDDGDSNRSWMFEWYNGTIRFYASGDGTSYNNVNVDDQTTPLGAIRYMAGVFKPSTYLRLIVNGCMVAEITSSIVSSLFNSNQDVTVGGSWTTTTLNGDFNGRVYMVRITPRAKSLEELWRAGGRAF